MTTLDRAHAEMRSAMEENRRLKRDARSETVRRVRKYAMDHPEERTIDIARAFGLIFRQTKRHLEGLKR